MLESGYRGFDRGAGMQVWLRNNEQFESTAVVQPLGVRGINGTEQTRDLGRNRREMLRDVRKEWIKKGKREVIDKCNRN